MADVKRVSLYYTFSAIVLDSSFLVELYSFPKFIGRFVEVFSSVCCVCGEIL